LKASTAAKLVVITVLNLAIVGCSSVLGISGDGTPGMMYWIQGIGGLWVLAFTIRAHRIASKGNEKEAVGVAGTALLYGFLVASAIGLLWSISKAGLHALYDLW
jgi:hypothetical protein